MGNDPYNNILNPTQTEPLMGKAQVKNNAGGYVYQIDIWAQLRRFLILGTVGGTYYVNEKDSTAENAKILADCLSVDGRRTVDEIVSVSEEGRAPKVQQQLFALAVAASDGNPDTRTYALSKLSRVARTASHLFTFSKYLKSLRGNGRAVQRAYKAWYLDKDVERLAYQIVKYRQRDGWTHRDLLRLYRPKTSDPARNELFSFLVKGERDETINDKSLKLIDDFLLAKNASPAEVAAIVSESALPWEALPTDSLNDPAVWRNLLDSGNVPLGALIRQLPRLTSIGVTKTHGAQIGVRLTDANELNRARIHPFNVLNAMIAYASGRSPQLTWTPNRAIVDALDTAFYAAFGTVEPIGNNVLLSVDVSGSMGWAAIAGLSLTPAHAATAMGLVTASVEPNYQIGVFSDEYKMTTISPSQRFDDVYKNLYAYNFGRTDCAQPMLWAMKNNEKIDTFITLTDNETWAGDIHPSAALKTYRDKTGIAARSIVMGMTSTGFSVADPEDPLSLDVVGLDTATPRLISDFARGTI